jgi:hypothetical protein
MQFDALNIFLVNVIQSKSQNEFPEPLAPMITTLDWDRTSTESHELEID